MAHIFTGKDRIKTDLSIRVALGEPSSKLSSSIVRISMQNHESLKKIMGWVNTLIEPVLLIFIAVGVLVFLLSMYIPLFRMAEQF